MKEYQYIPTLSPELSKMRTNARTLMKEYDALHFDDNQQKNNILKKLFGSIGNNVCIDERFHCEYGKNIFIGNDVIIGPNCTFIDNDKINIGNYIMFAPNVQIYTAFHPTNAIERLGKAKEDGSFEFCKTITASVTIGDNVWIGGGAIIMPGVKIGNNVVIGAGSIVTRDIPSNVIAFGNPCRVIRENK